MITKHLRFSLFVILSLAADTAAAQIPDCIEAEKSELYELGYYICTDITFLCLEADSEGFTTIYSKLEVKCKYGQREFYIPQSTFSPLFGGTECVGAGC